MIIKKCQKGSRKNKSAYSGGPLMFYQFLIRSSKDFFCIVFPNKQCKTSPKTRSKKWFYNFTQHPRFHFDN